MSEKVAPLPAAWARAMTQPEDEDEMRAYAEDFHFKRELRFETEQPGHVLTKQPEANYMFPRKNRKEP